MFCPCRSAGRVPVEPPRLRTSRTPWIVLGASLLFVAIAAIATRSWIREREDARTAHDVEETVATVERRMDAYVATLRGAAGLFAAVGEVDRATFRRYVDRQRLALLPGVQGIGWSRRFTEASEWQRAVRDAGLEVDPEPDAGTGERHAILYLEPLDVRNRAALGYDMSSDPARREAMEAARDAGFAVCSQRVRLVQEIDEHVQPGFLIYVPVYRGVVFPPTIELRRELLVGHVYAPFRAHDLFEAIIGRPPNLRVEVFDGESTAADALLYASDEGPSSRSVTERVHIAQRTWTVRVSPRHDATGLATVAGAVVATVGLVLSLLLFYAVRREAIAHGAAQQALAVEARDAQLRETFMGVLGHDLRNPLAAILMGAKLLLRRSDVTPELRPVLERIVSSGERASRMVSQLLDLTRVRVGTGIELRRDRVELPALLRDVAGELEGVHKRRVEVDVAPDLRIECDPDRLAQVVSNLLGNALTHGAPETPVRVEAVRIETGRTDGSVRIAVVNGGGPIPPEVARSLFDPFVRGTEGGRPRSEGLGLGLYISDQIVRAHGGSLVLQQPDGEIAFVITLPIDATIGRGEAR